MFKLTQYNFSLLVIFLCFACQQKESVLEVSDKSLSLSNEVVLYKEKPFTGTLQSKNDTLVTYKAQYINGKKEGKEKKFYSDGRVAEVRFYTNGKKTGIHKAWWTKDQLKFKYKFDVQGNPIGKQLEWYRDGQISKEANYANGKEHGLQTMWGRDGNIKANYEVINGERYGLIGSKKCKSKIDVPK